MAFPICVDCSERHFICLEGSARGHWDQKTKTYKDGDFPKREKYGLDLAGPVRPCTRRGVHACPAGFPGPLTDVSTCRLDPRRGVFDLAGPGIVRMGPYPSIVTVISTRVSGVLERFG